MDSYDEIPYNSTPFTETHPTHLAVLARLFGLAAPDPERCRVLELGCASGGNLIPMAWYLRGSEFVGIELSFSQAAAGAALIDRLGLTNIRLRQGDILDVRDDLGEFDYILAHGVYSWVPPAVREKILRICASNLSPNGIAYISYNTYPGWRMRGMLRDMLLHHARREPDPRHRLAKAREMLEFLDAALEEIDIHSARYLKQEIAHLRASHPSYLYHEYLAEFNEPFLFSQFMDAAGRHGLQYLCEADLHTMFPSTLGERAAGLLAQFDDLLEQEQYMDFIRNRTFRRTLLCRAEHALTRELALEQLADFAFYTSLVPPEDLNLREAGEQRFSLPDGGSYPVAHPLTKAALLHLAAVFPDSVAFPVLQAQAQRMLCDAGAEEHAARAAHLHEELFALVAHQAVRMTLRAQRLSHEAAERPRATALARVQAESGIGHVATPRHTTIQLDDFSTRLIGYLDGARDSAELAERLAADIASGDLRIPGGPEADSGQVAERVARNCERLLALFARYGVLEAAEA